MKRIFASSIWTRVILMLAVIFIAWSIMLLVSVKRQQAELAHEVGRIDKLNGVTQSIFALEKSLVATGPDSLARWRSLYNDYRRRRSEFDPGDPTFRDLQVNLIRTDSLLIRLDRLHSDFRQAAAEPVLQKGVEADFRREINAATTEVQNAVQMIRRRTGEISATMAENWNPLFVLVLVACGLAIAVTLLQELLQKEMARIKEADESLRQSEERIRQTFEQAPIGMATATAEGKFIQVNPAFCKLLGYSEAELLRRNLAEISHPEDLAAHREFMSRLLRGEISHFQLEKRYLTARRQSVYALLQASLVRDVEGAAPLVIEQVVDITEHKKAEFVRRQSEERFRELAENIAEVFWLTDPAKNEMLYVSPTYEKIWARSRQSLYETPNHWFDAIHPDDRERVVKATLTKQVIGQYDETYRILRPDGEARWIRDRAFPIRDEQGSVYRLAGIAEDITERKNAEAAIQENEQRWSFALEGSGAGVWDWDAQTNKVFYSRRWKEILGYQEHEIGDSLDECYSRVHPEDLKTMVGALEKHLRGETPLYISEHRERCKDGGYKWILDRGKVIAWTAEGKPLRVVGTHTEIAEQAQVKAERKPAEEETRNSKEQFRLTFEMAPIGMALTGVDGRFLQCNRIFGEMLGYSAEELQSKTWIDVTHPNDVSTNIAFHERLLRGEMPNFQMQKRYLAKGGHAVHVLLQMMLIKDEQGRPLHFISQATNLTAFKQAEDSLEEVRKLNAELEQRVAERTKELRESEERYRTLVEQMPDGIYRSTPEGRFIEVNPAMHQMFGYASKGEFLALDIPTQLYFSPDERNGAIHQLKEIGSAGITITRQRHRDGHEIWVEDHGRFVYDAHGNVSYNEGILRDITARKKAEEALQANEERQRRQSEALRDLVSSKTFQSGDLPEVFREITAAVARSMNVARVSIWFYDEARSKIVCQNLYEMTGERHSKGVELFRKDFLPYFEALAEGRYIAAPEAQTDYRTGCFTEAYLKPFGITARLDAPIRLGGEVIGIVCQEHIGWARQWTPDEEVFASSIADLAALAIEARELQKSETRFRTLVETMNDGLVQLDEKGLLIYVNAKLCEMTGFSREQLLGREVLPHLDAENQEILRQQIERRQTGESKPYEMEIRKKDGEQLPALLSPQPIFGFDGRFNGSFAVVTDISERKRMEEQIRRHAEELEQLVEERTKRIRLLEQQRAESEKLAATGRMSARIAHEINNPLAGIKNSFLLVKDGIPTTHRYYDYVRRIETEIERIARIVRQMFDLYRPEQDSVRSFPADLAIRDVVALLKTNCRERDIAIDVEINAPALNVALSESSLRQVLYNVIQNAIEASVPGGTVCVHAVSEPQKLTINVIDHGQGIPEDIRTKIFEPFFTTKTGLERSGLGLGLAVSKGLVEAMGGTLDFESTVGQGTTFAIVLPLDGASGKTASQ